MLGLVLWAPRLRSRLTLPPVCLRALPRPAPGSYAAPLHRIKTDDQLPLRLLTPFQAENDHQIKDTYNYVTVQVGSCAAMLPV